MANIGLSGTLVIIIISFIVFRPNVLPYLGRTVGFFHKKVKIKYKKMMDDLEKE